uniref:Uncharacterized protein n=1 Tax=Anguilla anguilla TaxID=7936 RepID=A0A0E9QW66_ANGAN
MTRQLDLLVCAGEFSGLVGYLLVWGCSHSWLVLWGCSKGWLVACLCGGVRNDTTGPRQNQELVIVHPK